jgi:hypothetical protein
MACVKTPTEQEKGEEEIMKELYKYYASVISLGHQEGHEETGKNWTNVDLLGRSGRANQQQNCIQLQLALASLKPGKSACLDQIFIKHHIDICCNL